MRVFCRENTAPTPGEILQSVGAAKLSASLDPEAVIDPTDPDWQHLLLRLPEGSTLIVDRDRSPNGGVVREEVDAFLARLDSVPNSRAKRRVVDHLRETRQVIALQVPTSSIDSSGWTVVRAIVRLLIRSADGMAQAEGQGFYLDNDLVVEL